MACLERKEEEIKNIFKNNLDIKFFSVSGLWGIYVFQHKKEVIKIWFVLEKRLLLHPL